MPVTRGCTALLLFGLAARAAIAQQPRRLTDPGESPGVVGVLEQPSTPGRHPAVVVIPGSFGWRPSYAQLARQLADSGFVALALDYYAVAGRDSGRAGTLRKWPAWKQSIRDAVLYLQRTPAVIGDRIALVGYSQGAFLAVSVAASMPAVHAVVDFFGGGGAGPDSLDAEVRHFPPLLILHGDADSVVPVRYAYQLRDRVLAHGGEVEMHIYPGARHAFNAPSGGWSEPAATDSWRRAVEFLRRRLSP